MSAEFVSDVGAPANFRNDRCYRQRVFQLALKPRRYRYLLFEVSWQLYVLECMNFLEKREDDYFQSLPRCLKKSFEDFNVGLHLHTVRNLNEGLQRYPSAREGDEYKDMIGRFHSDYRVHFTLCQVNLTRICLACTWDFPIDSENLGFAFPRIF